MTVGPSLATTSFASSLPPTQNTTTTIVPEPPADNYPSITSSRPTAVETTTPILPAATKTEKFLLTAADQESGSRDERLNSVIQSKYEAGLLKPYNYVKGYARLSRWMDRKYVSVFFFTASFIHTHTIISASVSQESKQQILQPLSVLRPKFRVNECFNNIATFNLRAHLDYTTGRGSIASRPRTIIVPPGFFLLIPFHCIGPCLH